MYGSSFEIVMEHIVFGTAAAILFASVSNKSFIFYPPVHHIADLRTAFDLLDRNQDGRVTANELQFMLRNLGIHVRDELIVDLITEASPTGTTTLIRQRTSGSRK